MPGRADRLARRAEAVLRLAGDARIGAALLGLVAVANVAAAVVSGGRAWLEGWPYAVLLGVTALSGIAAVAVRAPAAWREWRAPGPVQRGPGAIELRLAVGAPEVIAERLRGAGYRVRVDSARGRWALHGVRNGASRFAGLISHLALVGLVLGVAIGAAFSSETTFSLLPGDQALLDAPRAGFTAAVRLDRFDAEFGADDRPRRLDAHVTFVEAGSAVRTAVLRVNEPGDFAGYLVHPWTYGPAALVRVTTLAGDVLLDAAVPLDAERAGLPSGAAELPTRGIAMVFTLVDAAANELAVDVVGAAGLVESVRLRPGEDVRAASVVVMLEGFDAWVTFLSRRDPGLPLVFGSGAMLTGSLIVAFWLPRRRVSIRPTADGEGAEVVLRGERLDAPMREIDRLRERLGSGR